MSQARGETVRGDDRRTETFDRVTLAKTEPISNFPEDFGHRREIMVTFRTSFSLFTSPPTKGEVTYRLLRYKRDMKTVRRYDPQLVGSGTILTYAEIAAGIAGGFHPTKVLTVGPFDVFEFTNNADVDLRGVELEFESLRVRVETENDTRMLGREEVQAIIRCGKRD